MHAAHYLALSGLSLNSPDNADTQAATMLTHSATLPETLSSLYQFQVPELGEGGACSLFGVLDDTPYDRAEILGGVNAANSQLLADLQAAVDLIAEQTGADWLGIYSRQTNAAGEEVLVKMAYMGAPSRAEFPLTAEFAALSNNSTVGLSGKGRMIQSVNAYRAEGGEYYTCDPKVQAELCIPLFDAQDTVIGIIDAEAFSEHFFDESRLTAFTALAIWSQQRLSAG